MEALSNIPLEEWEGQVSAPSMTSEPVLDAGERRQNWDRRLKEDRRSAMNCWRFGVAVERRFNWNRRGIVNRRD